MRCLILTTGAVLILPIRLRRGTAWIPSSKESLFGLDCFLLCPSKVVLVANNLALSWPDGEETFYDGPFLRKNSPSAEQTGESDLFGKVRGGNSQSDFTEVRILGFKKVGNYAIRITFSDGHATGIYSWEFLKSLASQNN